jgi:hypothetical protein
MRILDVMRKTWRLAPMGLAAMALHTAQAATVTVTADLGAPSSEQADQQSGPGFVETAYARAQAGYGFGKIVAQATVDWSIPPEGSAGSRSSTASATASYADALTIDSTVAPSGELGVLWFDMLLSFKVAFDQQELGTSVGNLGSASFSTYWHAVVGGNTATVGGFCNLFAGDYAPPLQQCSGLGAVLEVAPGSYEARALYGASFIFGSEFSLGMRTQVTAEAAVGLQNAGTAGQAGSLFDGGNSIYWDGIADVTWEGKSVPYTIRSASGNDYSRSFAPDQRQVPEPSTALLFAGALGLLLRAGRARAERPRLRSRRVA